MPLKSRVHGINQKRTEIDKTEVDKILYIYLKKEYIFNKYFKFKIKFMFLKI